jgi:hypothetical protein
MDVYPIRIDTHWLNRERLFAYSRVALVWYLLATAWLVLQSSHGADASGKPLGTDFIAFWGASHLALQGHAADAYETARLFAAQQLAVPAATSVYGWFYPPTFFLLILPLALLPYPVSFALFSGAALAAYVLVLRRVLQVPGALWPIIAFPAVFVNLAQGQNGLLTAAIGGAALMLLDRRPLLAGALVGLLAMKPHLALLFPVALLASGHWRAAAAAAVSTIVFAAASLAVLSPDTGYAFVHNLGMVRAALESGSLPWNKMPTVFALLRLLGAGTAAAYMLHAVVAAVVVAGVAAIWRWSGAAHLRAAALMTGTMLISPYLYDYDLAWLGFPMAWLGMEATRSGWLRHEREVLAACWIAPAILPMLSTAAIQPGPFVSGALFAAIARRAWLARRAMPIGRAA